MQHAASTQGPDLRSYLTGLVLALILTAIPFALVTFKMLSLGPTVAVIVIAAIVQVVVHLRYFLHIDFRKTPRDNLLALFFAGFLIFIMVGGSLWIMIDLRYRMAM